jgi:hypothetical protein
MSHSEVMMWVTRELKSASPYLYHRYGKTDSFLQAVGHVVVVTFSGIDL